MNIDQVNAKKLLIQKKNAFIRERLNSIQTFEFKSVPDSFFMTDLSERGLVESISGLFSSSIFTNLTRSFWKGNAFHQVYGNQCITPGCRLPGKQRCHQLYSRPDNICRAISQNIEILPDGSYKISVKRLIHSYVKFHLNYDSIVWKCRKCHRDEGTTQKEVFWHRYQRLALERATVRTISIFHRSCLLP